MSWDDENWKQAARDYHAERGPTATLEGRAVVHGDPREEPPPAESIDDYGFHYNPRDGGSADSHKKTNSLTLTFFDDLDDAPQKSWLIKGVMARGETSSWIALPGKGKSALLTDIAIHSANGKDWARPPHEGPERRHLLRIRAG
jgi:AAA domain